METIRIKGLEIFAYHGVNPEEKETGLQEDHRKNDRDAGGHFPRGADR